jgi:hypothetical protein
VLRIVRERVGSVRGAIEGYEDRTSALVAVAFGDRYGLALFVGGLWLLVSLWRVGVFISDTYALLNTMVGLGHGHLWFEEAVYGSLSAPGTHLVDGRYYGRNYGQLFVSLPLYWLFDATSAVSDLRIVLTAGWSVLTMALLKLVGSLFDAERSGTLAGGVAAIALFVGNVAAGPTPLDASRVPVLALQTTTMLAAAFAAVLFYRLLAAAYGRRMGVLGGIGLLVATPVTFWAHVPKRHVFTVVAVLVVLSALKRSGADGPDGADALVGPTGYRCLAYATVGLYTWVQAAEGLLLFLGLVVADARTLRADDRRTLAVIAGTFLLSLVPFFLTNALVTGSPVTPPRLWPDATAATGSDAPLSTAGTGGTASESLLGGLGPSWAGFRLLYQRLLVPLVSMVSSVDYYRDLYPIYVRGGYVSGNSPAIKQTIQLSILESAPVVAGVTAAVAAGVERVRSRGRTALDALEAADLFALAIVVLFTAWYAPVLPTHAQITVRYLLVVYPVALYLFVRPATVRRALTEHRATAVWTYAASVLVGTQLFVVAVVAEGLGRGQAFQLHALVNLGLAAVLAATALSGRYTDDTDRITAGTVGLAAAGTTAFLLLSTVSYFQYGSPALPLLRVLQETLAIV